MDDLHGNKITEGDYHKLLHFPVIAAPVNRGRDGAVISPRSLTGLMGNNQRLLQDELQVSSPWFCFSKCSEWWEIPERRSDSERLLGSVYNPNCVELIKPVSEKWAKRKHILQSHFDLRVSSSLKQQMDRKTRRLHSDVSSSCCSVWSLRRS